MEKLPESQREKKPNKQDAKPSKEKLAHNASADISQRISKRKRSKPKRSVRSCSSQKEKGKSFRSSLTKKENSVSKQHGNFITLGSDDSNGSTTGNEDPCDIQRSILNDLCHRDNNFATPRRYLAEAQLPFVDQSIRVYTIKRVKDELDATLKDPLTVDRVPPASVVMESMEALVKAKNAQGNEGIVLLAMRYQLNNVANRNIVTLKPRSSRKTVNFEEERQISDIYMVYIFSKFQNCAQ